MILISWGIAFAEYCLQMPANRWRRNHVFAEIKRSIQIRIDLGLALTKHRGKLPKRPIVNGAAAKNDRITHRIEVMAISDLDEDLKKWLSKAYDLDA